MPTHDVTLIGCGLMGSALARGLANAGYRVAAWNRTYARAEALAADGVTPIESVVDAVSASPLALVCTTTYDAALSALQPVDAWSGKTIVNVTSGSPEDAERCAEWSAARGAEYLDGSLFCYPQEVATPEATIYFAGPAAVWQQHGALLKSLGGAARHASENVNAANVMYVGINVFFTPAQSAFVEAATYLTEQGISASMLRELCGPPLQSLRYSLEEAIEAISTGHFESDQATLSVFADGARFTLETLQQAGQRPRILAATVASHDAAEAAGRGHLGFSALSSLAGATDD